MPRGFKEGREGLRTVIYLPSVGKSGPQPEVPSQPSILNPVCSSHPIRRMHNGTRRTQQDRPVRCTKVVSDLTVKTPSAVHQEKVQDRRILPGSAVKGGYQHP